MELGKLYLKVELPKRAAIQFQQALRWDPSNTEALRLLGRIK
jgi:cytochrome c-type biogenesis protein CcmH/NrfG